MESNIGLKGRVSNLGTKGKQLQTFSLRIVRALASGVSNANFLAFDTLNTKILAS